MTLQPYEMSRILITGPNKLQESVIKVLHKLKVLHIVDHAKNELADIGSPIEHSNKLSELIVKVRALITTLKVNKDETEFKLKRGLLEVFKTTTKLNEDVGKLLDELKSFEDKISKNQSIIQELDMLKNLNVPLESFTEYKSLTYFVGYIEGKNNVKSLEKEILQTTKKFMLFGNGLKKRYFIVLFIDVRSKEYTSKVLQKINFSAVNLANLDGFQGMPADNLAKIEKDNIKLEGQRDNVSKELEKLGNDHKGFLLTSEELLSEELEKAEAPLKFAATTSSFLIKGWVPKENLDNTIDKINKVTKEKVFIQHEDAKGDEKIPVKLNNPAYAKPFEFFMDMYSIPKYKEIDPTFFMFLTYPLFFGLMLGDIGYGIVGFALFYLLKKKYPKASALFNVLLISSVSAIVFGLIYGEFFGLEEIGHFAIPHLLSRSHAITEMMFITIGIGIFHINWGLIVGFINVKKNHGLKHAIFEKGSWFVLEIGILLLTLSYMNLVALPSLVGWLFFVASLGMLYKGEGIKGIIEVPSILTNILSYLRLMAIGLSSVSIAVVVNDMAAGFFHQGGFLILSGILILVIGHVLNIVLALFGSFLHSLRLHYVEFFGKFYEGGAEKYKPFGLKNN